MINRILRMTGKPTTENQIINKMCNSKYHIRTIIINIIRKEFEISVNK